MKIRISDRAFKQLKRIPPPHRERLTKAISSLVEVQHEGKRLKGKLTGYLSMRVGDYRIIYSHSADTIDVIAIGHRSHIYEIIRKLMDFLFGL